MTDKTWTIGIPADDEGYIALRCPHCEADFKLLASDLQQLEEPELFCASCGLSHDASLFLLHPDVQDVVQRQAENLMADLINEFSSGLERSLRGSKHVKFTAGRMAKKPVPELRAITDLAEAELPCCETTVKVRLDQAASIFYCPFCGHAQN
jgi:transcription elongation factor Elf1